MENNTFKIQAYYKYELAQKYGISRNTFITWIALIPGLNVANKQRLLTPLQVQKIIEHLGHP